MNQYETIGSVKKFSTQAAKGGSIVIALELPLTDDNAKLASKQNKDCAVTLAFDNNSIDEMKGQQGLDFGDEDEDE